MGDKPATVVVVQSPEAIETRLNEKRIKICSIILMVCGSILVLTTIIALIMSGFTAAYGFWGGALFIATGVVGFFLAKKKTNSFRIATLVLGIIAAIIGGICLILSIVACIVQIWALLDVALNLAILACSSILAACCCECCYLK